MKETILQLIANRPKHYTLDIKKNPELLRWVNDNSDPAIDHFPTRVYCAVHGVSNVCPNGNRKLVARITEGLQFCGRAKSCKCNKESVSQKVSDTKQSFSKEHNEEINAKRESTMLERYGCEFNSQREEVKDTLRQPKVPEFVYERLSNKEWLETEYITNNRSSRDIAGELGVHFSTVLEYCQRHSIAVRPSN